MPDGQRVHDEPLPLHTDAGQSMSSQRPMSDEERAELEAVYQDRGCGLECDS